MIMSQNDKTPSDRAMLYARNRSNRWILHAWIDAGSPNGLAGWPNVWGNDGLLAHVVGQR